MSYDESESTAFVRVLREAFAKQPDLPARCAISLAFDVNQDDFSDVVDIVDRCSGRSDLVGRLRATHPINVAHTRQFDRHFWTVWTEACAFAWATEVAGFNCPLFTDDHGKPDLLIDRSTWIEAKTVEVSPGEGEILDRMAESSDRGKLLIRWTVGFTPPHPTLVKKFDDGLRDALVKRGRQDYGELIVFFSLNGINWPTDRKAAIQSIQDWVRVSGVSSGARVVISRGSNWREPIIDTG
ncbi:MAG: hypothetical protein O3C10_02110 [Chloroflexi bacterium]|nr:hypothetical protein [Chloroflexota bacterium]